MKKNENQTAKKRLSALEIFSGIARIVFLLLIVAAIEAFSIWNGGPFCRGFQHLGRRRRRPRCYSLLRAEPQGGVYCAYSGGLSGDPVLCSMENSKPDYKTIRRTEDLIMSFLSSAT